MSLDDANKAAKAFCNWLKDNSYSFHDDPDQGSDVIPYHWKPDDNSPIEIFIAIKWNPTRGNGPKCPILNFTGDDVDPNRHPNTLDTCTDRFATIINTCKQQPLLVL